MAYKELITFLGTKDLKKTSLFYQDILGLTLYKDQGICQIYNVTAESKIGFCTHMPIILKDRSPIITLVTDEVENVYKRLIEAEVEISGPPEFNPKFNIYHFFLKDPNGYSIEIQKFLD